MIRIGRKKLSPRKFALIVMDLMIAVFSMWIALHLHYDPLTELLFNRFLLYTLTFAGSALIVFYSLGFHDQIWRFASIRQYMMLLWGALAQTLVTYAYMRLRSEAFAIPVYVIYFMMVFIFTTGVRVAYRMAVSNGKMRGFVVNLLAGSGHASASGNSGQTPKRQRVIVIGAGVAGSQLIREMQQHNDLYEPVALIDDNPLTHTYKVLGVPVYGDRESIEEAVKEYHVDCILLAIPSAPKNVIRDFINICSKTGCELKTVPPIQDLIDNRAHISDIKDVEIDDLLNHADIILDTQSIAAYLENEVVLVTGGGGTIGSELCRQIARFKPKQLIIFDIYENNAYQLQYELNGRYGERFDLVVLIGSIRDQLRLKEVFEQFQPSVVFHSAAYVHIPLMEISPDEAVKTNIFGTANVARTAADCGVKRFVLLSTTAAVNPDNTLGTSMRIAEMLVQMISHQHPQVRYSTVRFGNVLGSRGSVIQLFKQQIKSKHQISVTHPEMSRHFIMIKEAAQLVIQAGAIAENGDIFVLDMGEPIRVVDLAKDLIRLSGLEPDIDVQIEYTGLRPGEHLDEAAHYDCGELYSTRHHMILRVKTPTDDQSLEMELQTLKAIIKGDQEELNALMNSMADRIDEAAAVSR